MIGEKQESLLRKDESSIWSTQPSPCNFGKRNYPHLFPTFQIKFKTDQTSIEEGRCLVFMSLLPGALHDKNLLLLGRSSINQYPM